MMVLINRILKWKERMKASAELMNKIQDAGKWLWKNTLQGENQNNVSVNLHDY
jgi:ribulose-5-phosphate 4-epimerase/fuculose-1-phosphate aldolase